MCMFEDDLVYERGTSALMGTVGIHRASGSDY